MSAQHDSSTTVAVIGAGYVGATAAAAMIRLGHRVVVIEKDADIVRGLRSGRCRLREPGVDAALSLGTARHQVTFDTDLSAVAGAGIVFVCVPTPARPDGSADTGVAETVIDAAARYLAPTAIMVLKSTVPVGTADRIRKRLAHRQIEVVSNPEFLREGRALQDFLCPDRVVIGGASADAIARVADLYRALESPVITTDSRTAELAKYACNAFLALKLSYVNELADLADAVGAEFGRVTEIMGLDPRIGPAHLTAGPGWGGSCLPKDSRALVASATTENIELSTIVAAIAANERRVGRLAEELADLARRRNPGRPTVAILGLTFKPGTADRADSPSLRIAGELMRRGVSVVGHDPTTVAGESVCDGMEVVGSPESALAHSDAAAILTDWPNYRHLTERCDLVPWNTGCGDG